MTSPTTVTRHSPAEEKVALFAALFRGREDVYPRRFESATTGRSGYQPACENEWVRGLCDKPKTRCSLCGQRKFLPVTLETLRWHLSGEDGKGRPFVMGVYPLLEDEQCWFVAADFDKEGWAGNSSPPSKRDFFRYPTANTASCWQRADIWARGSMTLGWTHSSS